MNLENLTEEQMAKARECKTAEELQALASKEGIELSLDDLEEAAGGASWGGKPDGPCDDYCPLQNCGTFM